MNESIKAVHLAHTDGARADCIYRRDYASIGSTDKFSTAILAHLFRPLCVDKSST